MINEVLVGDDRAIVVVAIGEAFEEYFNRNISKLFIDYCKKYNIGFIVINEVINSSVFSASSFRGKIWLQTLFVPNLLKKQFPNYKYLAFMDADCIPSPVARNIFDFCKLDSRHVNLTSRSPLGFTKGGIGRRTSLLRKLYLDDLFPLDSLLSSEHEDDCAIFGLAYAHPTSTIGTIIGDVDVLSQIYDYSVKDILNNYTGYTQFHLNAASSSCAIINMIPYEFQAIWSSEISLYYPFFYTEDDDHMKKLILQSVLLRVDFLHFAGAWFENDLYGKEGVFDFDTDLNEYMAKLQSFLNEKMQIKSYGPLRMNLK